MVRFNKNIIGKGLYLLTILLLSLGALTGCAGLGDKVGRGINQGYDLGRQAFKGEPRYFLEQKDQLDIALQNALLKIPAGKKPSYNLDIVWDTSVEPKKVVGLTITFAGAAYTTNDYKMTSAAERLVGVALQSCELEPFSSSRMELEVHTDLMTGDATKNQQLSDSRAYQAWGYVVKTKKFDERRVLGYKGYGSIKPRVVEKDAAAALENRRLVIKLTK